MQNKLKSTQLVHIIKKYIPEIIVFILLILSIIVYFKISNKDKSDISVPTDKMVYIHSRHMIHQLLILMNFIFVKESYQKKIILKSRL